MKKELEFCLWNLEAEGLTVDNKTKELCEKYINKEMTKEEYDLEIEKIKKHIINDHKN